MSLKITPDLLNPICNAYLAELRPHLGVFSMNALPPGWTHIDQNIHPTSSFGPLHQALWTNQQARVHTYGQTRFRIEALRDPDDRPILRLTVVA